MLQYFGRPFVKRFALCYRTVVLSVCDVRALWPNGWTDQDETWHAGRPRPWPHCIRWGPSSPTPKGAQSRANFRPISLAAKWLHGHDATWYGGRTRPRRLCVRWGTSPLPPKGGGAPPQFSAHVAHFYCGQTAACLKIPLGMELGLGPGDPVLDGDPVALSPKGGAKKKIRPMFIVTKRLDG